MRWNRPQKNQVRKFVAPSRTCRNTLWLAGEDALDVLNAWDNGLLDKSGHHVIVERDAAVIAKMSKKLDRVPIRFDIRHGELHEVVGGQFAVDYMHIDLCGTLTCDLALWLARKVKIREGAECNFTFLYGSRGSDFIPFCEAMFTSDEELQEVYSHERVRLKRDNDFIAFYCAMLRCLLRRYGYRTLAPIKYQDTLNSMVCFPFREFRAAEKPECPEIVHLLSSYEGVPTMPAKNQVEVQANNGQNTEAAVVARAIAFAITPAQRAAATRRLNNYVEKRSTGGTKPIRVVAAIRALATKIKQNGA